MILLDTVSLIKVVRGEAVSPVAAAAIVEARRAGELNVSAASAWEIGLLAMKTGARRRWFPDASRDWFATAVTRLNAKVIALDAEILTDSVWLPGDFHPDPADRFIVATARVAGLPLATSDRKILQFAAQGFVRTIAC